MRKLSAAILVLALTSCNDPTVVVVNFTAGPSTPSGIASIDMQLMLSGRSAATSFSRVSGITLPTTAALQIGSGSGPLTINAIARSATGAVLDQGSATVNVVSGKTSNVTLAFNGGTSSVLAVDKPNNDFGGVGVGSSSAATFTITNNGGDTSGTLTTTLGGTDASLFTVGDDQCSGQTLAPAASCTLTVTFAPTSVGSATATLTVSGMPGEMAMASLSGSGVASALAFDQSSHAFGTVSVGSSSPSVTFTLSNSGTQTTGALTTFKNGDTTQFTVTDNCNGTTLGAACTYVVTFAPTSVGAKSVTVMANASPGGTASFTVTGTGQAPDVPLLWWKLDGNGNNSGTATGAYTLTPPTGGNYVPGKFGQALQATQGAFGTVTGTRAILGAYAQYTISMWVNSTANPNTPNSFFGNFQNTTAPYGGITAYFASYQSIVFCAASTTNSSIPNGGSCTPAGVTVSTIAANTWHHILWRYNGTGTAAGQGANIDFYVDDVKVFTLNNDSANNPVFNMNVTDTLYLFAAYGVTYDDVRIYNKVYSDAVQCTDIIGGTWNGTSCTLP